MVKRFDCRLSHHFWSILLLVLMQSACVQLLPKSVVRARYLHENPQTTQSIAAAIHTDRIVRGMTHAEVYMAWGRPDLVRYAEGAEQWKWGISSNAGRVVSFDAQGYVSHWRGNNPWPQARLFPPTQSRIGRPRQGPRR